MNNNTVCKTSYITKHVILKDVFYLLFNIQFKTLYDYYKYVSGASPEFTQFINIEHEDISFQVRFTFQTKKDPDNLYSKIFRLDRRQLTAYLLYPNKKSDSSQENNAMDSFDNKEIMNTLILNEEFSIILNNIFPAALKGLPLVPITKYCRANFCTFDDYCNDKLSTDVEVCKPL